MKRAISRSVASITAICCIFAAYSDSRAAGTATNLLTICISATTTTQASKCTAWQYNVYSPSAYIESYPQVSPGPTTWTDPAYEYRLGSTITGVMGVKVCPTPLAPGTSFYSPQSDPCPNNVLVSASTTIYTAQANAPTFSPTPGTYGPTALSSIALTGQQAVTLVDSSPSPTIYYTTDGSLPGLFSTPYTDPILLPPGEKTSIQATAFSPNANGPSPFVTGVYSVPLSPSDDFPEVFTQLLTNCTSATTTTQASKCTAWQYNFFSPAAYIESYPQFSQGPKGFTDPAYEYRVGSSITGSMGVKVCPTPLLAGTSFSSTSADACPNNVLVEASTAIPSSGIAHPFASHPNLYTSVFLHNDYAPDSCGYYQNIGAIPAPMTTVPSGADPCALNPDGSFTYGLTKAAWLSKNGSYGSIVAYEASLPQPVQESFALFINVTDLDFVREHHAIANSSTGQSAAYVCNYRGPDFYHSALTETGVADPAAVDAALQNAQSKLNPLPCVAIDYGFAADSKGRAIMRFLVFNPAGNLVRAVDLDGRGPKQIPNACSACHGIPYLGPSEPTDVDDQPTEAASYIPFDKGNLEFSSAPGPTPAQETQIKALNMIILANDKLQITAGTAGDITSVASSPLSQLISNWYANNSATQLPYTPPALQNDPTDKAVYDHIYAPFCRSCHVANHTGYDPPENDSDMFSRFTTDDVCSPNPASDVVMPNSKVAFDRFWTTHASELTTYSATNDLPAQLKAYINNNPNNQPTPPAQPITCSPSQFPSFNK